MGGATTQIAFYPHGFLRDQEIRFYVKQTRWSLYAKSYVKYGQEQAILRAKKLLANSNPEVDTVSFPCFMRGYNETMGDERNNFESPCLPGKGVCFVGTGEAAQCAALTERLLLRDQFCMLKPCAMMGTHMDQPRGHFVGVSAFFTTLYGIGLIGWNESKDVSRWEIEKASTTYCSRTFGEVNATTADSQKRFIRAYCFMGFYMSNILEAYGFTPFEKRVTYARKMGGQILDWTHGAVLYETIIEPLQLDPSKPPCNLTFLDRQNLTVMSALSGRIHDGGRTSESGLSVATAVVCILIAFVLGLVTEHCRSARCRSSWKKPQSKTYPLLKIF